MATTGMNLAEVRQLSEQLRGGAETLRAIVSAVDGRVSHTSWVGADADRFKYEWWPGHRQLVLQAADHIQGLGQSARNNADEQERTSGTGGAVGSAGGSAAGVSAAIGAGAAAAVGMVPGVLNGAGRFMSGLNKFYEPIGSAIGLVGIADWKVLRNPDLPVSRLMSDLAGDGRMKVLGHGLAAVSFGAGAYETYQTFAAGDYYEGTLDAVETGVGGAAHFIPGPAGYLTGTAAEIWTDNFRVAREIDWNPTDDDYYQYMNPFVAENWTQTILPGARDGLKDGLVMTFENLLP
jgi:hypothetical protein